MLDAALLGHINIDYDCRYTYSPVSLFEYSLCEENGYVPGLDQYVEAFKEALPDKFKSGKVEFIGDEVFDSIEDRFFKNIGIAIIVNKLKGGEKDWYRGVYSSEKTFIDESDEKLHNPVISLVFSTPNSLDIVPTLSREFAHELTHAYEDYCRKLHNYLIDKKKLKGKKYKETIDQAAERRGYVGYAFSNEQNTPKLSARNLKKFLYWTDPHELNAEIGSLKVELKSHAKELSNSRKVSEILEGTEFYRSYKIVQNIVKYYFYESENIPSKIKDTLVSTFQQIIPETKINNFNNLSKFCISRWENCDKRIKGRVGKIALSLYESSQKNFMVDDSRILLSEEDYNKHWLS